MNIAHVHERLPENSMAQSTVVLSDWHHVPTFPYRRHKTDPSLTRKSFLEIFVRLFTLCSVFIESEVCLSNRNRYSLLLTMHLAKGSWMDCTRLVVVQPRARTAGPLCARS